MYFVLLSFIPNPLLTEAPLICVSTSSVAVTHRPVSTYPLHMLYTLVLFKIFPFGLVSMLNSKIENTHWAEKTTTTPCGVTETATTWNFMLWLFLNNRNALWHVMICHDGESRVVAVKGNDHNELGLHENITRCRGRYLLQPRRDVRQVSTFRRVS